MRVTIELTCLLPGCSAQPPTTTTRLGIWYWKMMAREEKSSFNDEK
jgi:hypothetical protein